MADTNFVPGTTIASSWLNDVNDFTYGAPNTASALQGAALVGFNPALNYAANTVGWGLRTAGNALNVLTYIPPAQWAAILAGTSTYDATSNIQTALDSGASQVFFPGGNAVGLVPSRYHTTAALLKPGTVDIIGAGAYNTAITAAHNGIIVDFTPVTLSGDSYNTMQSIMVRNAATFTSSIGISLNNVNQVSMSRVRVEGCAIGMQLSFVLNSNFSEMTFVNATNIGLYIFSAGLATGNNHNTYRNFNFNTCVTGIRIDGTGTILSAFEDVAIETCTNPLQIVNGNNIVFHRLYLEANTTNISITGGDKISFRDCTNVSAQQFINTAGFAGGRVVVQDLYDLSGGGIIVNPNVMVYDFGQIRFPSTQVPSSNPNTLDDYEEGSWTPADASGAGLVLTVGTCTYTKIGNRVFADFDFTYPATASGLNAEIGGMPFPSSGRHPVCIAFSTLAANSATHGYTNNAGSTFFFGSVTNTTPTNANLTGARFVGTIVYKTT